MLNRIEWKTKKKVRLMGFYFEKWIYQTLHFCCTFSSVNNIVIRPILVLTADGNTVHIMLKVMSLIYSLYELCKMKKENSEINVQLNIMAGIKEQLCIKDFHANNNRLWWAGPEHIDEWKQPQINTHLHKEMQTFCPSWHLLTLFLIIPVWMLHYILTC